jgi:serine/threonine-protein kinase
VTQGDASAKAAEQTLTSLAEPAPSIGPTAIMPAVGRECAECKKPNHPGAPHCVFCGSPFAGAPELIPVVPSVAARSDPMPTYTSGPGPLTSQATLKAWSEASDDDAPASRRPSPLPSSDDLLGPIADPLIGVVVAERYRIVEPLGRGGMGIVYKVEHIRIGKLLAMKLLTGELSRNPEVVRRFKQEALTASKLSSANTVQVFDFGAAEGLTYLVMELIAGEDLARTLRTLGPMPFSRLGKIVIQVCSSLAEAHQKGIVHRDVKPENVMLLRARDNTDVAKVLDFGLAKLREGAELNDVTSQGAIVGTPYFMAPEQIRGESVDHRADIYALGALMYRALTGHYPFNGPTPMAVFTKHLTEPPVPPASRAPELGIPPAVSAIVLKALAKSPADRFQKIEELQAALVEEVRASGTSSVETLLDSGQLRRLAKVAAEAAAEGPAAAAEIATRDEVERYERKLRRQRYGALVSLGIVVAAAALVGVKVASLERGERFKEVELEPNNTAPEANPILLGKPIVGHLGKRIDPAHGDRDFYTIDVPARTSMVALKVTALPNFAMCTMLYRERFSTALGQYCVGRAGRELSIPALRLEPGRYLVAEVQDLDPYGGPLPFVHENVSDFYTLSIAEAKPEPGAEIEPNDQVASANPVGVGATIAGTIGWARDEDVFCVAGATPGTIRWRVRDVVRDAGAVLEATPLHGTAQGGPVRVHPGPGKVSSTDAESPWLSDPQAPEGDTPRCLRVRLTPNPWGGGALTVVPSGGSEAYSVEVVAAP